MTDAHFHRGGYATFLAIDGEERRFWGLHPWEADSSPLDIAALSAALEGDPLAGVGEIGLDRLKSREISGAQRAAFEAQLRLAAEMRRPVVLHGAKCWGEVVKACVPFAGRIPAFLFHGFSRSAGLLPQIYGMNGFVSIGPALLNDHAVNYRAMAKSIPLERLLIETDMDESAAPQDGASSRAETLRFIYAKLAEIRGVDAADLERALDANARRFTEALA